MDEDDHAVSLVWQRNHMRKHIEVIISFIISHQLQMETSIWLLRSIRCYRIHISYDSYLTMHASKSL